MVSKSSMLILASILFTMLLVSSASLSSVRAHTFSQNESTLFLSLIDQIKSTLMPIKDDVSSNIKLANEQGQYARTLLTDNTTKELKERNQRIESELIRMLDSLQNISSQNVNGNFTNLNDLLAEAVTVRIEKDQLKNSTVQALVVARDINKVLAEYTTAFKEGNVSSNLNLNMNMKKDNMSSMNMGTSIGNKAVKNLAAYQRADALTEIATERFNAELKGKSNFTSAIVHVVKGLDKLKTSIQNKEPPMTVMGIIHGQIQPNLQVAFDLQLAQVTNAMPMSMSESNMSSNFQSNLNKTMNLG
jgi:hypothetical protein